MLRDAMAMPSDAVCSICLLAEVRAATPPCAGHVDLDKGGDHLAMSLSLSLAAFGIAAFEAQRSQAEGFRRLGRSALAAEGVLLAGEVAKVR